MGEKDTGEAKRLEYEAQMSLTEFLVDWGFTPDEAMSVAKEFWSKHKDKLKRLSWSIIS